MKIALLFEFSTLNGGERSMLAVLDWLQRHRSPLEFVAIGPFAGPLADALRQRRIELVNWSACDRAGLRLPIEQIEDSLLHVVADLSPQLLHANSLAMGRLTGRLARQMEVPVTAHLRDIIKLSAAAVEDLNGNLRLFAVSKATRDFHVSQGLDPQRVAVFYNGVDLEQFQPRPATGRLHDELHLPTSSSRSKFDGSARLIMTIGQIGLRKGQNVLVDAVSEIVRQIPNAQFIIIGERNSQKAESIEFEKTILQGFASIGLSDRLHLLGYRNDIGALLNEADLLVHPAKQEPLGRVLLEALASGVPIVATDVGGTREIIVDQITGSLVPPNNPAALATAVVGVLSDESKAIQMGIAGRARAEAMFSIQTAALNLEAVWSEILNVPPRV